MKIAFIVVILMINSFLLNSQTLIIKGKVINIKTGEPVSTTFVFIDDNNKMLRTKSNSLDGSYQQAINYGKKYKILLSGYIPIIENEILDLTKFIKYEELNFDIKVKPIEKNYELIIDNIFEPNDTSIVNTNFLEYLKNFVLLNKNYQLKFIISSEDSWFDKKRINVTTTNSKGKKTTKSITLDTKSQLSKLLDARIRNFKKLLSSNNLFYKDEAFVKELIISSPENKKKKKLVQRNVQKYGNNIFKIPNIKIIIN